MTGDRSEVQLFEIGVAGVVLQEVLRLVVLKHGEPTLGISEQNRFNLVVGAAAVVAVARHAVVSIHKQDCIIIQILHNVTQDSLCFDYFALDFGVIGVEGVASVVDAENVAHQQVESFILQYVGQIAIYVSVVRVQVSDVVAWVMRLVVEVLAEHGQPDVITGEHHLLGGSISANQVGIVEILDLVQHAVLGDALRGEIFFGLKE